VPLASGVLEGLERFGDAPGGGGGGGELGLVAGDLGGLADGVEVLVRGVADDERVEVLEVGADQREEFGGGELERVGGGEGFEQGFVTERDFGLAPGEELEEFAGGAFAATAAELVEGGGIGRGGERGFGDEGVLDIEIADAAGGSAKLAELAEDFGGFAFVAWKIFELGEEIEVSFDATGFGAELVDGGGRGVCEADGDGGF